MPFGIVPKDPSNVIHSTTYFIAIGKNAGETNHARADISQTICAALAPGTLYGDRALTLGPG